MKKAVFSAYLTLLISAFFIPGQGFASVIDFQRLDGYAEGGFHARLNSNTLTIYNDTPGSLMARFYFYYEHSPQKVSCTDSGFKSPTSPGFLPGYSSPPRKADFSFGFTKPQSRVTYGNSISFIFDSALSEEEIMGMISSNNLRVGIFVQDFSQEESAKFISRAVPLPAPLSLFLAGLGGLAWFRKKTRTD